jgi:hypothetical protein
MVVPVTTDGDAFSAGVPRPLFEVDVPEPGAPYPGDYAVSADGQRSLVNTIVEQEDQSSLTIILNWAGHADDEPNHASSGCVSAQLSSARLGQITSPIVGVNSPLSYNRRRVGLRTNTPQSGFAGPRTATKPPFSTTTVLTHARWGLTR